MPDDLLAVLLHEILALRADVRLLLERETHTQPRGPLSSVYRELFRRLCPAIGGAFGSENFASIDLKESAGPRVIVGHLSAKAIGKLLARVAESGETFDGVLVQRVQCDRAPQLWRLVRSDSNTCGYISTIVEKSCAISSTYANRLVAADTESNIAPVFLPRWVAFSAAVGVRAIVCKHLKCTQRFAHRD